MKGLFFSHVLLVRTYPLLTHTNALPFDENTEKVRTKGCVFLVLPYVYAKVEGEKYS